VTNYIDINAGVSPSFITSELISLFDQVKEDILLGKCVRGKCTNLIPNISQDVICGETELRRLISLNKEVFTSEFSRMYPLKMSEKIETDFVIKLNKFFPNTKVHMRGHWDYPTGGYMSWHTNGDFPGIRFYASYSFGEPGSFRYMLPSGEFVVSLDQSGWTFRVFRISHQNPLWHCVCAKSRRLSFGFHISE